VTSDLRSADDVRAWLAERVYAPRPDDPPVGAVGLEVELFPFWVRDGRRPTSRLALVELIGLLDDVPGARRNAVGADGRPSWLLDGVLLTEEPGAQVEVAGPPEPDVATALAGVEAAIATLRDTLAAAGAGLAGAGLDCWSAEAQTPVQVAIPRYAAMTEYFRRRGDLRQGHLLMCSSASLQVNVDLGPPEVARRRWRLANLVAPVLTAAFAASPVPGAVNGRAQGWRDLDPTRTGVAPPLVAGGDDPLADVTADALRADVLLVERDGETEAGRPGWSFAHWVADGHPRFGRPTGRDLATHLTTLFPESRLRGFLEVRGIDELPRRLRDAPVALLCGLLYDDEATERGLAALEPHRAAVPDLLARAARDGLRDPLLGDLAEAVLDAALEGAERLPGCPTEGAAAYLDRFVGPRAHPSDELRSALDEGPEAAWGWAAEPA
jgi:glutamate--cysteine ligase